MGSKLFLLLAMMFIPNLVWAQNKMNGEMVQGSEALKAQQGEALVAPSNSSPQVFTNVDSTQVEVRCNNPDHLRGVCEMTGYKNNGQYFQVYLKDRAEAMNFANMVKKARASNKGLRLSLTGADKKADLSLENTSPMTLEAQISLLNQRMDKCKCGGVKASDTKINFGAHLNQ